MVVSHTYRMGRTFGNDPTFVIVRVEVGGRSDEWTKIMESGTLGGGTMAPRRPVLAEHALLHRDG